MIFNFRNWVLQTFPFLEDDFDALTDYELFCKMMGYVKNFAKDNIDFNKRLTDLENYINNLDLQDEVNNKLDEMAQDGTLENLISEYLRLATTYVYNNVAEMKLATNLINGSFARTSGFYSYNDGGGSYYKIRQVTTDDDIDEMFIIALADTSLVAELIVNDELNIKQIGAKGLISVDDTLKIQKACEKEYNLYFPKGTYFLNTQLVIFNATNRIIRGDGIQNTIFKVSNNQVGSHTSYISNSVFEENINNFTMKDLSINCGTQNVNRYGLSLLTINRLNLENIEIYNNKGYATRLNDSTNITANNLYLHDCYEPVSGDGVAGGFYGQNMKNVQINNTKVINCGDHAFYLTGDIAGSGTTYAENIQLNNVYCKNIGSDGYTAGGAITIYGDIKNVELSNCIIEDSREGIHISNHGSVLITPKDITISNCIIKNSLNTGIYLQGLAADLIKNVTILNNVINTTTTSDGISLRQCDNINVVGNVIRNSKRIGIEIINTDNSVINNNILCNNFAELYCGTRGSTHAKNNTISNNTIFTTDDYNSNNPNNSGIFINTISTNTILLNNNVYNHLSYNFLIRGSSNKSILQSLNNKTTNFTRNILYGDNYPTTVTDSEVGDICLNINATAGGNIGWVCVTAGTPGTWKAFGTISA